MELVANPFQFFAEYIAVTGLPHLGPEKSGDPRLVGRRLGLLHGSSWVAAWGNYFGRVYLPGVQLVDLGNDAIQLNFMRAFAAGQPCPPQENIDCFVRYAIDLVELSQVQAILLTCSTMNRSYSVVEQALRPYGVPVIQIDIPMMERAMTAGGKILVIATHGPTVESTGKLLQETAARLGKTVTSQGALVEEAWHCLMEGDVQGHNRVISEEIGRHKDKGFSCVVLAQLSMSVFRFSHPDPLADFGLPVLSSGQCGFERVREVLMELPLTN
jgi:hypothetical protein